MKEIRIYPKLVGGGKRGAVLEFSRASRKRILDFIAQVDWIKTKKCLLVTLTYPDSCFDLDAATRTQHRSQFMRDLEAYAGRQLATIWRCEWKPRKTGERKGEMMPHWHIIIFRCAFIPHQVVNAIWKRITGEPVYVRTEVEAANTGKHATKYVAKYVAKAVDANSLVSSAYLNKVGRPWGCTRKALIPLCLPAVEILTSKAQVGRAMDIAAKMLGRHYVGAFTIYSDIAAAMAEHVIGKRRKRA